MQPQSERAMGVPGPHPASPGRAREFIMAVALSLGGAASQRTAQNDLKWTVGLSVLFHLAVGWIVVNQLIGVPLEAEPEPLAIQVEPLYIPPPPPVPLVETDPPPFKEIPRVQPKPSPVVPEAAEVEPLPIPPQPPISGEPTVTSLPETVPAAAPRPTHRVPVKYPVRAESREMSGIATVEIIVAAGGAVSDVRVVNESPQGYGFGDAAADSVWRWQFAGAQPGTYRVTVRFELE
jgi:protein TonB